MGNSEDPDNDNYAILNQLEQFRSNDGKFYFKLTWPNSNEEVTMEWSQTSNPLVEDIMGYEPINVPYTGRGWGGLEPSSSALMDGSVLANFKESWFWAVGAYSTWGEATHCLPTLNPTMIGTTHKLKLSCMSQRNDDRQPKHLCLSVHWTLLFSLPTPRSSSLCCGWRGIRVLF